jgi:hypothetical protein
VANNIPLDEQETVIHFMRGEDFATISTTDSTMITKMDKLCRSNPDMYWLKSEDGYSKIYKCRDKSMVSLRSKKREVTDEQRKAAGERMKKYQAAKNI